MRQCWLVTYDVCDAVRLRKVYKILRRYGDHLQLSVFRCVVGEMDLIKLKRELGAALHAREDQILLAYLGPEDGRGDDAISALGRAYTHPERHAIVV